MDSTIRDLRMWTYKIEKLGHRLIMDVPSEDPPILKLDLRNFHSEV